MAGKKNGNRLLCSAVRLLEVAAHWLQRGARLLKPADVCVYEDLTAFWRCRALYLASSLGLPRTLDGGPRSYADLAQYLKVDEAVLRRLVRTLVGEGYFRHLADGRVTHTRLSRALGGRAEGLCRLFNSDWYQASFGPVVEAARAGANGFELAYQEPMFAYLDRDPEAAETFAFAMRDVSVFVSRAMVWAHDFSGYGSLLDVGGGDGTTVERLRASYPGLELGLLDRARPVQLARQRLGEAVTYHEGDFFRHVPEGYRALLLKNILHDWDDPEANQILRNCRQACGDDGRLLVVECLLPAGDGPCPSRLLDFNVWMTLGGRERSADEFGRLFHAAGFELEQIIPTVTPMSILKVRPRP